MGTMDRLYGLCALVAALILLAGEALTRNRNSKW